MTFRAFVVISVLFPVVCVWPAGCGKKTEQPSEPSRPETRPSVPSAARKTPEPAGSRIARPHPAQREIPPLVSAAWLKTHLNDKNVVVLDVSPKSDYAAGHIPGSRPAFVKEVFDEKRGNVILETITDKARVQKSLRDLGVNRDSHVVLAWNGTKPLHTYAAAKAFFSLYGFGIKASILDGGVPAWKRDKNPVSTAVPKFGKGDIVLGDFDRNLIVTMDEIKKVRQLIDCRPAEFFRGLKKLFAPRAGTIPNAANLSFVTFLNPDLTFKKPDEIRAIVAKHKVQGGAVLFCATGGTAAVAWFAARIVAGKKVRLYDGSMNEWAAVASNPVIKGK